MRKVRKIISCSLLVAMFIPDIIRGVGNEAYPFQLEEALWEGLGQGHRFGSLSTQKWKYRLWTADQITLDVKGSLNTAGRLIGPYQYKGVPMHVNLAAEVKNGTVDTELDSVQLDAAIAKWMGKYSIPRSWRFKQVKLEGLRYEQGRKFSAQWRVVSAKRDYIIRAEMAESNGRVEDAGGLLGRFQDFLDFIETDDRSRIILQNNKSGIPVTLEAEGETEAPVFIARHPMHKITWDERADFLWFDYLDALSDVQKMPEIKRALRKKEVSQFVGPDVSKVRVKGKGSEKEGFEIYLVKPEEKKGLMIKLKNKKVVQMEEVKEGS